MSEAASSSWRDRLNWGFWRRCWWLAFLGAIALALVVYRDLPFAVRSVPGLRWVGELHDNWGLWIILKVCYAHTPVLCVCVLGACAALVLWPHRRWWPCATVFVVGCLTAWIALYEMWWNALPAVALIGAVLLYVICRYWWDGLLLNRVFYGSLRLYVETHPRCQELFDSIRATRTPTIPAQADVPLWAARGASTGGDARATAPGLLSWFGAGVAGWMLSGGAVLYRLSSGAIVLGAVPAGRSESASWRWFFRLVGARAVAPFLGALRFLVARATPGSLKPDPKGPRPDPADPRGTRFEKCKWLWDTLDTLAQQRHRQLVTAEPEAWLNAYEALIEVTEAKAECLAFTREGDLAGAAELYDYLSCLGLARQFWLASVARHRTQEARAAAWAAIGERRVALVQNAARLRELDAGAPALLQTLSRCQSDAQQAKPDPGALGRVAPTVARKAVEVALDSTDYIWAKRILTLNPLDAEPPPAAPGGQECPPYWQRARFQLDALLEGHLYWRIAQTAQEEGARIDAYQRAALAFDRGGHGAELAELKADVDQASEQSAARDG